MCKILKKLAILSILLLGFIFVIMPIIISAEEIENTDITEGNVADNEEITIPGEEPEIETPTEEENNIPNTEENPPLEDNPTEEEKGEDEQQPPIDEEESQPPSEEEQPSTDNTEEDTPNSFEEFIAWLEEIGFVEWLKEELIPAIPQSFWSLLMSLLVLLSTIAKNKKASNDIQTSINNMGLAKTSMDDNNSLLNAIVTNQLNPAIELVKNTAELARETNKDLKEYKADLKAEIDRMKANEETMMKMLSIAFLNTPELVKNGQAEIIAKVVRQYEKDNKEKETA